MDNLFFILYSIAAFNVDWNELANMSAWFLERDIYRQNKTENDIFCFAEVPFTAICFIVTPRICRDESKYCQHSGENLFAFYANYKLERC